MRQIVLLETNPADGGQISVNCVFWFSVAVGKEVPLTNFVSAFKTPTAQEATDLQAGKIVEERKTFSYPASFTAVQIKGALAAAYTDRKTYRDSLPNQGQYYGVAWDGTTWG